MRLVETGNRQAPGKLAREAEFFSEAPPTYLEIAERYEEVIDLSLALVEEKFSGKSEEFRFVLAYGLSVAQLTRPLLRHPKLLESELLQVIGDESYNPHLVIDRINRDLLLRLLPNFGFQHLDLFVEEMGDWMHLDQIPHSQTDRPPLTLVVDPIDGTSDIKKGLKTQASGIILLGESGEQVVGSVVSLTNHKVLVFEGDQVQLFLYDEKSQRLSVILPKPERFIQSSYNPRIAILERRLIALEGSQFYTLFRDAVTLPTFGGHAFLALIDGEINSMADPVKGQPWYEAVLWASAAKASQMQATLPDGGNLDIGELIRQSKAVGGLKTRVPLVISANPVVHQLLCQSFLEPSMN